jgi:hypothetical protein
MPADAFLFLHPNFKQARRAASSFFFTDGKSETCARFQEFALSFFFSRALQSAFEGDACEDEHYEHEGEEEDYVAAYCGEVGAFEEDLFDCAYRMGFGIEVREGA